MHNSSTDDNIFEDILSCDDDDEVSECCPFVATPHSLVGEKLCDGGGVSMS